MCYRTTCSSCGKPSYGGCGRHVESVLGDVRPQDRCKCKDAARAERPSRSWLDALLGRDEGRRS